MISYDIKLLSAKTKMYLMGAIGAGSAFCSLNAIAAKSNIENKPNVIIILSDDQGYGDFSVHGNPVLETPALDRLHNESIRFERFHVAPLCTPTRGQLLTGMDAFNNKAATVLTARNLMRRDVITMPEIFRQNGYATGIFGKWHLGDTYPDRPMDRGFQKNIWIKGWGLLSETEYDNDYYETRYLDSLDTKFSGEYCTNLWFNKSMEWMDEMQSQGRPFFTFLSLNVPHGPFNSQHQDFNYYADKVGDQRTASFFGMLRNVDRNMERLEAWLIESGLKENTLVIYMTDNGTAGGANVFNAGMRESKGSNYEGGHRAACFIRWPAGGFVSPRTIEYETQIQDILPTFIDLLELNGAPGYSFDGVSLGPLLLSNSGPDDRMFVIQYGGHVKPEKYFSCVVWNAWRLIGEDELYNINTDPGQEVNIAGNFPDVLDKMKAFYEKWWSNLEPGINVFVPIVVGAEMENPVVIASHAWEFEAVNTQWGVAQATGPANGGVSHIYVAEGGNYKVELSRWPFHLNRDLITGGPATSIGGTQIRAGRAVQIEYGCLSFNGHSELVSARQPDDKAISFDIELQEGQHTFRAWFKDAQGLDLCGAYYVRLEKL